MGIHHFHTWLREKYPEAFIDSGSKKKYDHIYIDLNFMLHLSMFRNTNEKMFLSYLYKQLDDVITKYTVLKSVVIAIDGPSPYSKINLQRKRRQDMINPDADYTKLSSLCLTPGTQFMLNLIKHLDGYIKTRKKWFRYRTVKFQVSATTIPDEGEIKLLNQLIKNGHNNNYESHLIVGNDADLIVMAMGLKNIYNIDILVKNKRQYDLISIPKIIVSHNTKYGIIETDSISLLKNCSIRQDFMVLSIMMGNDYFPKVAFTKFDSLWHAYKQTIDSTRTYLTNGSSFNIIALKKFFTNIVLNLSPQYKKIQFKNYIDQDEDTLKGYLEGLLWCTDMYMNGECPMYDYEYNRTRAINPANMLFFLETLKEKIIVPRSDIEPLDAETCALLLLPKKAQCLLPKKYYPLQDTELKRYYEMEDCIICSTHRKEISNLNKEIYALRTLKKKCDKESAKVGKLHHEFTDHKKIHITDLTINKIRNIVEVYIRKQQEKEKEKEKDKLKDKLKDKDFI